MFFKRARQKRIANSIYTGLATSRAYVQSSSNLLEIFHYLCKSFTVFEHTLGSLTLEFKILTRQETNNLLIRTEFLRCTELFLSYRADDTIDLRRILNNFASIWPKLFKKILTIKFSENALSLF